MVDSRLLCTICARGGSQGVANKNVRPLLGKPLIAHTIERARESGLFEHVVVSTDSDEIARASEQFGAEVFFKRPAALASNEAAKIPVIRHALLESERHYGHEFATLVDLDATSPLRSAQDIRQALERFLGHDYDNLFSVVVSRKSPYFNLVELDPDGKVRLSKPPMRAVVRRQDAPACYDINGSVYIWRRAALLEHDSLFLDRTGIFIMPEERSVDIDSELDLKFVEFLLLRRDWGPAPDGSQP